MRTNQLTCAPFRNTQSSTAQDPLLGNYRVVSHPHFANRGILLFDHRRESPQQDSSVKKEEKGKKKGRRKRWKKEEEDGQQEEAGKGNKVKGLLLWTLTSVVKE